MKKIFMLKPFNGLKARIPRGKFEGSMCVQTLIFFLKKRLKVEVKAIPPPSLLGMIYNFWKKSEKKKKKWDKNEVSYRLDNRILIYQWNQIKCSN